jgi:hypothetical protein
MKQEIKLHVVFVFRVKMGGNGVVVWRERGRRI